MEEEPETPRALSWENREAPEVKIKALRPEEFKRNEWWVETREKGTQEIQTETSMLQGWVQLQTV